MLPRFGGDYVLLTPIDILTKDEAWISHKGFIEDFSGVVSCVPNDQLRDQINLYLTKVMPPEPTKEERSNAFEKTILKYPELMDVYIGLQESNKDAASASSLEKSLAQKLLKIICLVWLRYWIRQNFTTLSLIVIRPECRE